jgi:hypothetical protein
MTSPFRTDTLVLVLLLYTNFCRMWRLKVQHKQAAGFLVGIFITLGMLGALATIAIPHAVGMVYESEAREKETELLRIQRAVDEMLSMSSTGTLVSIGPTVDLSLVRTSDAESLSLTDFLPEEVCAYCNSGTSYSFTADGIVLQMTN